MSVMLGDIAVTDVTKYLNDAIKDSALPSFQGKAYKYERPEKLTGEYIVVNHLPFVHREVVGEGIVNVNIHVPELKNNLPDTKRLGALAKAVVRLFPEGTYLGKKAYYDFYSDSRPVREADSTYYLNLQLQVTFNNLNS